MRERFADVSLARLAHLTLALAAVSADRQEHVRRAVHGSNDVQQLSHFRQVLSTQLQQSEALTQSSGITALRKSLMVHGGSTPGRSWATIGELAERLQAPAKRTAVLVPLRARTAVERTLRAKIFAV